jgi:hypothetical protein
MGRSRGGLTTKIHALTDAHGLPLELILTPGQAADCPLPPSCLAVYAREQSCWLTKPTMPIGSAAA